jgi:hypothetical protein
VVTVDAPSYVPFEPTSEQQRELRAELRAKLAGIKSGPGQILYANLAGKLPAGADVENALFYNLDARGVFASMGKGVCFELDPDRSRQA